MDLFAWTFLVLDGIKTVQWLAFSDSGCDFGFDDYNLKLVPDFHTNNLTPTFGCFFFLRIAVHWTLKVTRNSLTVVRKWHLQASVTVWAKSDSKAHINISSLADNGLTCVRICIRRWHLSPAFSDDSSPSYLSVRWGVKGSQSFW